MAYLFEKGDALELFCRLVSKKHKIPLKDFKKTTVLDYWFVQYSNKKNGASFSKEITSKYKTKPLPEDTKLKTGAKLNEYVRFVYDLCFNIRYSIPVVIKDFPCHAAFAYLGDKEYKDRYRKKLMPFIVNEKQRSLEGKKWILYFYDELEITKGGILNVHSGVSRAILELKSFGKVDLTRHKKGSQDERIYSGFFQLTGNDKYLALKMKIKKSNERDLRMLFYIGSDDFEISIGISANVSESLWARTCILEPYNTNSKLSNTLGFFSKEVKNPDNKSVPDHVWEYFKNKSENKLELPKKNITTISEFWKWKNMQEIKKGSN